MTPSTYVWTPEAIEAHTKSVEHWERLVSGEDKEEPTCDNCPLCALFMKQEDYDLDCLCIGCPISERTGKSRCHGTPYIKAWTAFLFHGTDSPEFRLAAQAELEFLRGLRPKE